MLMWILIELGKLLQGNKMSAKEILRAGRCGEYLNRRERK
jgi:hypothetical protein